MKILVTGGGGFIGRNLVSYLSEHNHQVTSIDLVEGDIVGDISDSRFVFDVLGKLDIDAVVHLAAIADIKKTIEDTYRCYSVNCFGTLNLLEMSYRVGVRRFIYSSSANVYGVPRELPVKETTPFNPRTPYDYSKVISENLVRSYWLHHNLPTVVTRSWILFGKHDIQKRAVPRFIRACLKNEPIPLYNGGRDTTDPYYIENFCYAMELCLTKDEAIGEEFNIGTGSQVSIRELAEMIKRLTDSSSELQDLPPRSPLESEPMISYPSIEKIRSRLGYQPIVSLEEGLKKTIEWISSREADI